MNLYCKNKLLYTLEKDNFADSPFLALIDRNGPSFSFGTNFPCTEIKNHSLFYISTACSVVPGRERG